MCVLAKIRYEFNQYTLINICIHYLYVQFSVLFVISYLADVFFEKSNTTPTATVYCILSPKYKLIKYRWILSMTHTIHNWSSSSLFRNITQSQLSAQSTSQKTPHALEVVLLRYGKQLQSQKQLNLNFSFHWNVISGIAGPGISSIASGKNVSFTFQSPWRRITKDT